MATPTQIWHRAQKETLPEKVYGGAWIDQAYKSEGVLNRLVSSVPLQKTISRAVGAFYGSPVSRSLVGGFVENYNIPLDQFEVPEGGYDSFNSFFIRKYRPGVRPFPTDENLLGSPAEGRLTVFPLTSLSVPLTVKGVPLAIDQLLGSQVLASSFVGGHAWVFRLCPVDYHRFHFPDAGRAGPSTRLGSALQSVNPAALDRDPLTFLRNERQLCLFESKRFGSMILLEVGALCVGRIVQTYAEGARVERGQEKGYFAFGGSTVILFTQNLWVKPDADLLEKTAAGVETFVRLGEAIGTAGLQAG